MGKFSMLIENQIPEINELDIDIQVRSSLTEFINDMKEFNYSIKNGNLTSKKIYLHIYSMLGKPNKYNFIFDFVDNQINVLTYGNSKVTHMPFNNLDEFNNSINIIITNYLVIKAETEGEIKK